MKQDGRKYHGIRSMGRNVEVRSTEQSVRHLLPLTSWNIRRNRENRGHLNHFVKAVGRKYRKKNNERYDL